MKKTEKMSRNGEKVSQTNVRKWQLIEKMSQTNVRKGKIRHKFL